MENEVKCNFCTIPENKECEIIRNEYAWAFPTNIPIVPGHTLICPIRCVPKFEDLTMEERESMFSLMAQIKKSLTSVFDAEGFNHAWNENEVAGQAVPHIHIHVLPRKVGDAGIYEYEPRKFLYQTQGDRPQSAHSELVSVAKLIKSGI